ncbi:DoxX family protein [Paenibacillus rigui]|uniref:DoxX family protein n=1 Tax=Paenibacillus rigui TaxID=554312 RepID=A0A229UT12_9BACL|nr:DoxX family protein [Paenibacillus rigui]OXM86500.1 hypothetical protein CF651_10025 [Paenibacillus rigui]
MITLLILFGSYGVLYGLAHLGVFSEAVTQMDLAAYAMSFFLVFFGLSHFYKCKDLLRIVPGWVPFPRQTVYVTGVMELMFAIGLLIPSIRFATGIALVLFFVAIFPANLNKAMKGLHIPGALSSNLLSWVRLAYQPLFIGWTLYSIEVL